MIRKTILVVASVTFASAPLANGADYTASVLYLVTMQRVPQQSASVSLNSASAGQVVGQSLVNTAAPHASLWTAAGLVDLNPTNLGGISGSNALAIGGAQEVGYGFGNWPDNNDDHALLWTGTAASAVDLNPTTLSGITNSLAYGTSGAQQVGYGYGNGTDGYDHALLWTGAAASAVDLNPTDLTGIIDSYASGTDGTHQVGSDSSATGGNHALLWSGTAASAVDLNPTNISGVVESNAVGVSGTQEVGDGVGNGTMAGIPRRAMLWNGTAASAVDLSPASSFDSIALATNGAEQVGWADDGPSTDGHAMLWTGTAASGVDLQTLLPSNATWIDSGAYSIDASGNVYGIADEQIRLATIPPTIEDYTYAVEWSPVPEPATASLLLIAGAGMLMRRRQKQLA